MHNLNSFIKSMTFLVLFLLVSCEDEAKENQLLKLDCTNHYRAESYRVAARTCLKAAKKGIVLSQWLLGNLYYYDPVSDGHSKIEAVKWLSKAADAGMIDAQVFVGEAYLFSDGVEENFERAYHYFKAASESDASTVTKFSISKAEFYIGMMFYDGSGRKKDLNLAVSWLKKSASKNHAMSINNLAWLYATSKEPDYRDSKAALFWAEKLAVYNKKKFTQDSSTFLDTQAAAFALSGQFDKAIEFQNLAIEALPENIEEDQLVEFQKRLEAYQGEQAWIEMK